MSFSKTGRVLLTEGKEDKSRNSSEPYALVVAGALRDELGSTHRAIKTVARWTGVSERTAKNWLAGTGGPSGEHLVALARNSDEVFAAFVLMTGRDLSKQIDAQAISELRETLRRAAALANVISLPID